MRFWALLLLLFFGILVDIAALFVITILDGLNAKQ